LNQEIANGREHGLKHFPNVMTKVLTGIAALPLIGYLVLLGFACYASFVVGHWPSYANPDPKTLPVPCLGVTVGLLVLASIFLVPITPCVLGLVHLIARIRQKPLGGSLRIAWAAWVIGLSVWVFEASRAIARRGGLLDWIFD
jgi:hypothetical protein